MHYLPFPVRLPVTMAIVAIFLIAFYTAGFIKLNQSSQDPAPNLALTKTPSPCAGRPYRKQPATTNLTGVRRNRDYRQAPAPATTLPRRITQTGSPPLRGEPAAASPRPLRQGLPPAAQAHP